MKETGKIAKFMKEIDKIVGEKKKNSYPRAYRKHRLPPALSLCCFHGG